MREWSISLVISSNFIIPATPSNRNPSIPYVKRTSKNWNDPPSTGSPKNICAKKRPSPRPNVHVELHGATVFHLAKLWVEGRKSQKVFRVFIHQNIHHTHRIQCMYDIYANIWGILMVHVTIYYIAYMDPMDRYQLSLSLPILDTLQTMTNSLLVNVDIPIDTKRLKD